MPDPDMTFFFARDGVFPLALQLATGKYTEAAREERGRLVVTDERAMVELTDFARLWLANPRDQQGV